MTALKQLGILLLVIVTSKYHVFTISIHISVEMFHVCTFDATSKASVCLNMREYKRREKNETVSPIYILALHNNHRRFTLVESEMKQESKKTKYINLILLNKYEADL